MSSTSKSNGFGSSNGERVRSASHAGSWYSENPKELDRQLNDWLEKVGPVVSGQVRAIISPHAGYTYCGDTAAYAFKQFAPDQIKRIFILGPSHVAYLSGCAVTTCTKYRTPLGDLIVDTEINNELLSSNSVSFDLMDLHDEEAEHSIEMQLPFIAKIMESRDPNSFKIVPILVGSLNLSNQIAYGKLFAKYIADPSNVFVISSDFCHWGNRFRYTPNDSTNRPLHEQITDLDKRGMDAISTLNPSNFNDYLKKTQNTICGRNPICVLLQSVDHFRQANNQTADLCFLKYSQSNKCRSMNDSSVSYAAGVLYIKQ